MKRSRRSRWPEYATSSYAIPLNMKRATPSKLLKARGASARFLAGRRRGARVSDIGMVQATSLANAFSAAAASRSNGPESPRISASSTAFRTRAASRRRASPGELNDRTAMSLVACRRIGNGARRSISSAFSRVRGLATRRAATTGRTSFFAVCLVATIAPSPHPGKNRAGRGCETRPRAAHDFRAVPESSLAADVIRVQANTRARRARSRR